MEAYEAVQPPDDCWQSEPWARALEASSAAQIALMNLDEATPEQLIHEMGEKRVDEAWE